MAEQYYQKLNPDSEFSGTTWGLIGLHFLQFLITLFTLGFGAAYASVIGYRWYANHTKLNGKQLVFEGTAWELFGKYIRWTLLTIITLGIYSICVPVRLEEWKISKTALTEIDYSHTSFIPCEMPHHPAPDNMPAAMPKVNTVPYPNNPYVPYPGGSATASPRPAPAIAPMQRPAPMQAPAQRPAPMPRPAPTQRPVPPRPVVASAPRPAPTMPKPTQPPKRNPYQE